MGNINFGDAQISFMGTNGEIVKADVAEMTFNTESIGEPDIDSDIKHWNREYSGTISVSNFTWNRKYFRNYKYKIIKAFGEYELPKGVGKLSKNRRIQRKQLKKYQKQWLVYKV